MPDDISAQNHEPKVRMVMTMLATYMIDLVKECHTTQTLQVKCMSLSATDYNNYPTFSFPALTSFRNLMILDSEMVPLSSPGYISKFKQDHMDSPNIPGIGNNIQCMAQMQREMETVQRSYYQV